MGRICIILFALFCGGCAAAVTCEPSCPPSDDDAGPQIDAGSEIAVAATLVAPECATAADCAGTFCAKAICVRGICEHVFAPAGEPLPEQVPGDCRRALCDGAGNVVLENDAADIHDDENECTQDVCIAGEAKNIVNGGAKCSLGFCTFAAECVQCLSDLDCPSQMYCSVLHTCTNM
jgi:hypothetical protein